MFCPARVWKLRSIAAVNGSRQVRIAGNGVWGAAKTPVVQPGSSLGQARDLLCNPDPVLSQPRDLLRVTNPVLSWRRDLLQTSNPVPASFHLEFGRAKGVISCTRRVSGRRKQEVGKLSQPLPRPAGLNGTLQTERVATTGAIRVPRNAGVSAASSPIVHSKTAPPAINCQSSLTPLA